MSGGSLEEWSVVYFFSRHNNAVSSLHLIDERQQKKGERSGRKLCGKLYVAKYTAVPFWAMQTHERTKKKTA